MMDIKIEKCKCVLLLILTISLSGCTLIDKNNSNLVQLKDPDHNKFISGTIKENKYYAMDHTFSIAIPFSKGTTEYRLMDIGEFYHERGSNITFGPFGNDKSTYSVELFRLKEDENDNKTSFEKKSLQLLGKYQNNLYKFSTENDILKKKLLNINGKKTIHWSLLQKENTHPFGSMRHHIFAIELKHYIAILVVEKSAIDSEGANYTSAYEFANSLSLFKNTQDQKLISSNP